MTDKIDANYQGEITCPYCGWKDSDSWEYNLADGDSEEIECGECEKKFDVTCSVTRDYSSTQTTGRLALEKVKAKASEQLHEWWRAPARDDGGKEDIKRLMAEWIEMSYRAGAEAGEEPK